MSDVPVRTKIAVLLREGRVRPDPEHPDEVFWVHSLSQPFDRPYRVQLGPGFVTCTCAYGAARGGMPPEQACYHAYAVGEYIQGDWERKEDQRG